MDTSSTLFGKSVTEMTDEELTKTIDNIRSSRRSGTSARKRTKAKKSANKVLKGASREELLELLEMLKDTEDE